MKIIFINHQKSIVSVTDRNMLIFALIFGPYLVTVRDMVTVTLSRAQLEVLEVIFNESFLH